MTIYEKLQTARTSFHGLELKKTGLNKFAGYKYFELADFLIPGLSCMGELGLVPVISFTTEVATMTIHDTKSEATIVITSPMADANLKGCHPIQNLGAVQTYQRRYLWVTALEIVEHDQLDSSEPVKPVPERPAQPLATEIQKLKIQDYIEAGNVSELDKDWLRSNWKTLSASDADVYINKFKIENEESK